MSHDSNLAGRPPKHGWRHSGCCDAAGLFQGKGCNGCCDRGCCYVVKHACCLPCTFGRIAEKGADGSYSVCCCGLTAGAFLGAHFTGGPILPCAVSVRRSISDKYNIGESCCCSWLHICLCPFWSILQMTMEVEDQEGGEVGTFGEWTPNGGLTEGLQPVVMGQRLA